MQSECSEGLHLEGGVISQPPAAAALICKGCYGKGVHAGRLHEAVAPQVPCAPACIAGISMRPAGRLAPEVSLKRTACVKMVIRASFTPKPQTLSGEIH